MYIGDVSWEILNQASSSVFLELKGPSHGHSKGLHLKAKSNIFIFSPGRLPHQFLRWLNSVLSVTINRLV